MSDKQVQGSPSVTIQGRRLLRVLFDRRLSDQETLKWIATFNTTVGVYFAKESEDRTYIDVHIEQGVSRAEVQTAIAEHLRLTRR